MAGEQTPPPAVFGECAGESRLKIERCPAGDSFCVCLPRDNCGVAVDAHFHVAILNDFVFGIIFLCFTNIVDAVSVTLDTRGGQVAFCLENGVRLVARLQTQASNSSEMLAQKRQ